MYKCPRIYDKIKNSNTYYAANKIFNNTAIMILSNMLISSFHWVKKEGVLLWKIILNCVLISRVDREATLTDTVKMLSLIRVWYCLYVCSKYLCFRKWKMLGKHIFLLSLFFLIIQGSLLIIQVYCWLKNMMSKYHTKRLNKNRKYWKHQAGQSASTK